MNVDPEFESVYIPIDRQVLLSGSSIYAVLYGTEIWKAAYEFLENISVKDRLRCFKLWCKSVKDDPWLL